MTVSSDSTPLSPNDSNGGDDQHDVVDSATGLTSTQPPLVLLLVASVLLVSLWHEQKEEAENSNPGRGVWVEVVRNHSPPHIRLSLQNPPTCAKKNAISPDTSIQSNLLLYFGVTTKV